MGKSERQLDTPDSSTLNISQQTSGTYFTKLHKTNPSIQDQFYPCLFFFDTLNHGQVVAQVSLKPKHV